MILQRINSSALIGRVCSALTPNQMIKNQANVKLFDNRLIRQPINQKPKKRGAEAPLCTDDTAADYIIAWYT